MVRLFFGFSSAVCCIAFLGLSVKSQGVPELLFHLIGLSAVVFALLGVLGQLIVWTKDDVRKETEQLDV